MEPHTNLDLMEGVWESVNLNPAVMVVRNPQGKLCLCIIHVDIYTRQAHPAMHEIEQDESGLFIGMAVNRQRVDFEPVSDTLSLSFYGDYLRN